MRAHGEKDPILTNNGRSWQIIADFKEKSPFQQIETLFCQKDGLLTKPNNKANQSL